MASKSKYPEAQNPLILRCHRLMEAFAKSDDERDFYLDRVEGFILFADLDKTDEELGRLEKELNTQNDRYAAIPKMTFYETKKIMEGFVNEKVYDIDTKEKLLEIIQSKEARENFLDFIYDQHAELEKWSQYYQERSRIRIIEWLRQNDFEFVFEEDLEFPRDMMEKIKANLFDTKAAKEIVAARKALFAKSKTYYSNEALNPRPKRGRPPKQVAKAEVEPEMAADLYTTVPQPVRAFLFLTEYTQGSHVLFSQKFETEEQLMARKKPSAHAELGINIENYNQKLSAIRDLSQKWVMEEKAARQIKPTVVDHYEEIDFEIEEEEEDDEDDFDVPVVKKAAAQKPAAKKAPPAPAKKAPAPVKAAPKKAVPPPKKPAPVAKKAAPPAKKPAAPAKKAAPLAKKAPPPKKLKRR